MDAEMERKLLILEVRTLSDKLVDIGGQNPLDAIGDLDTVDLTTLRQLHRHLRDLHRSLGGSRGQ